MLKNITRLLIILTAFVFTFSISANAQEAKVIKISEATPDVPYLTEIPDPVAPVVKLTNRELDDKTIIVFDNFFPFINPTYYYFDNAYWKYMTGEYSPTGAEHGDTRFADKILRVPFSASTFSNYDITDFDLACFPLGAYSLEASQGGITVISKIKEMLEAGKNVVVWSRFGFTAYANSQNEDVREFLEDGLGISPDNMMAVMCSESNGGSTTWYPWISYGKYEDPIGLNMSKSCNATGIASDGSEHPALIDYDYVECFKLNDGPNYDWFDSYDTQSNELKTGCRRIYDNKARAVFWSYGFENMHFDTKKGPNIMAAMIWAQQDLPDEGAVFEAVSGYTMDFGFVPIGDTLTKSLMVYNAGIVDLKFTVKTSDLTDLESNTVFGFADGDPGEVTIAPGAAKALKISFFPQVEDGEPLLCYYSFWTNEPALDGQGEGRPRNISLKGQGGHFVHESGYFEPSSEIMNFDSTEIGKYTEQELLLHNKGQSEINLQSIKVENTQGSAFLITEGQHSQSIAADSSNSITVRFAPKSDTNAAYILFTFNPSVQNNETEFYVYLNGLGYSKSTEGPVLFVAEDDKSIDFGDVEPQTTEYWDVNISNSGTSLLTIESINFSENTDDAFGFVSGNDVTSLDTNKDATIRIQFLPTEEKEYSATLEITSDAINDSTYEIRITGMGKIEESVKDGSTPDGLFTMNINPNPVKDIAVLDYNIDGINSGLVFHIVDINGKVVKLLSDADGSAGSHNTSFDVSGLASGKYILVAYFNGQQARLPLLISK